jgi:hypothetical protein
MGTSKGIDIQKSYRESIFILYLYWSSNAPRVYMGTSKGIDIQKSYRESTHDFIFILYLYWSSNAPRVYIILILLGKAIALPNVI